MPQLTVETIRRYVGDTSFQRAEKYFEQNMIMHTRRAGDTLKADCHGSRSTPYRVSATVTNGKIANAICSCPVGAQCKHIAALLLTWLHRPEEFVAVEETHAALERRSKAELIALVEQMITRDPGLELLLDLPLPTDDAVSRAVNLYAFQRQAAAAFDHVADEWGAEDDVARELDALLDIGDQYRAKGAAAHAAAVYQAVSDEVLKHYEEFQDESGALGSVVQHCVTGLGECLPATTVVAEREQIVHALFDIYQFDIRFGGMGLSDDVPDLIAQHAQPSERKQVVAWLRAAMKQGDGGEWSSNWRRETFGEWLLKLQKDELDDDAYLKLCRESHRLNDLVDRLLALGRVGEATREATQAEEHELLEMADVFVRHGQAQPIEQLLMQRAHSSDDERIMQWLQQHCEDTGDTAGALDWAHKLFDKHASLERYVEMRSLAQRLNNWQSVRAELLKELEADKLWHVLTEIYLDEHEIDAALRSLRKMQTGAMGNVLYRDLVLDVAQAAEATHPRDALQIYLRRAERAIDERNRSAYQQACQYLLRVRELYTRLGEAHVWQQYLSKLQSQHKTLRALNDEIAKAGLV